MKKPKYTIDSALRLPANGAPGHEVHSIVSRSGTVIAICTTMRSANLVLRALNSQTLDSRGR